MNKSCQLGHALSTTMVIVILFSILSLTVLRNGLMDHKIANAFGLQQLQVERHLSALQYVESYFLPNLLNPDTALFRDFSALESAAQLEVAIPIRSLIGIVETRDTAPYLDPVAYLSPMRNASHDLSTPVDTFRVIAEVLDHNTGHRLTAVFQYRRNEESGRGNLSSIQRLSLRRET